MKKAFLLASVVASSLLANAQFSLGPMVEIGMQGPRSYSVVDNSTSTVVVRDQDGDIVDEYDDSFSGTSSVSLVPKPGFSFLIGAQAKIDVSKYFAISPGLGFRSMKSTTEVSLGYFSAKMDQTLNYLSIPILFQGQYPVNDVITFGLGVGPNFNYLIGGKGSVKVSAFGMSESAEYKVKAKSKIEQADADMNDDVMYIKPFNVSLMIAPFIQFNFGNTKLLLSPTYYIGLSNISPPSKYTTVTTEVDNSGFSTYTTVTTTKNDTKENVKTGGWGLTATLLFGKN